MIDVLLDEQDYKKLVRDLNGLEKEIPYVLKKSINDTSKQARKMINKKVQETYTLKTKYANKNMQIRNATNTNLEAILSTKGKSLPLYDFSFKFVKGNSVRAKVKKQSKLQFLTGINADDTGKDLKSFIATMSSGHTGIFRRIVPRTKAKTGNYKIKEYMAPSIPQMIGNREEVLEKTSLDIEKILKNNIHTQIEKILKKG